MGKINFFVPSFLILVIIIAAFLLIQKSPIPQQYVEFKTYPSTPVMKLPKPDYSGLPLEEAILKRRSVREYSNESLTQNEVSQLLFAAQGKTNGFRTVPSAGALYPLEVYLIINRVENITAGLYHYNINDHSLELLRIGDLRDNISKAAVSQKYVGDAAAVFIFTAVEERTTKKYGERGKHYIYIEVGHASQNLLLEATSLGLGSVPIGGFIDEEVNKLLGIDGKKEYALYINLVGTQN